MLQPQLIGDLGMKKLGLLFLAAAGALGLCSCAAGSLTAGISGVSVVSTGLTADGEQKIVDRVKSEVAREYGVGHVRAPVTRAPSRHLNQ